MTIERILDRARRAQHAIAIAKRKQIAKKLTFQGIDLRIDRPAGFVQTGKDEHGQTWERTYKVDYGFIPGTEGGDGEGLDVYVGPNAEAHLAHWIIQRKSDGSFDEFKLMLGFDDQRSARSMWEAHTPKRFFGGVETTSVAMMKALLGLDPQPLFKSAAVREHAFATLLQLARQPADPLVEVQTWARDRGLFESSHTAPFGASLLRAGEALLEKGADRPDAIVARVLLAALRDSWDAARVMALETDELARVSELVKRGVEALVPAPPASTAVESPARDEGVSEAPVRLTKAMNDEQRYVLGIVLEPDITDTQGHTYSAEVIRKAAHEFMRSFQNIGDQHQHMLMKGQVQLVESWVAPAAMRIGDVDIVEGTWLMGLHFVDDAEWAKVKSGERTGLSIEGTGRWVEMT